MSCRCGLSTAVWLLSLTGFVVGYTFQLDTAPQQCGQVELEVLHGHGDPPYSLLVVPFGPTPAGVPEVRKVFTHNFTDERTTFTLPYPAESSFVMMLSDSKNMGSGGTSPATQVTASSNSSCLPLKNPPQTAFSFQILPTTAINQCDPAILAWSNNQGNVSLLLLIPGGDSVPIPISGVGPQQGGTTGFRWVPNVRTGTTIVLVAGDDRGPGAGGSVNIAVGNNPDRISSCINSDSPSTTNGTPAGAVETGGGEGGGGGGSSTNTGAIAGGVVGGLAALIIVGLLVWFIMRKRKQAARRAEHNLDLLPDGQGGHEAELYTPEPYVIPPRASGASHAGSGSQMGHTTRGEDGGTSRPSMSDYGRRYSALSTTDPSENTTSFVGGGLGESRTNTSRKSPMPPLLRPVNVLQHEDAGELPDASGSGEPDTIELPPAYTSVRPKKVQQTDG